MDWDKVWDVVINKAHVALAAACQAAIFAYHFKTGHDIGANVQTTVNWFYAFLAGHFGVSQKWPDTDANSDSTPDSQQTAPVANGTKG